jgi:ketosteroid isomerase-like protein
MSERQDARQAIRLRGNQRRSLDERLLVRVPVLTRLGGRALMRLDPRSRLRRWIVARRTRQTWDALNRGDEELFLLLGSDPEIEVYPALGEAGVPLGADLQTVYRGRPGLRAFLNEWAQAWEQIRYEPEELIDCGGRVCVLMRMRGRGRGSGVEVDTPFAQLVTLRQGMPIRVQLFWNHHEAMEAAGLRCPSSSQPSRPGFTPCLNAGSPLYASASVIRSHPRPLRPAAGSVK